MGLQKSGTEGAGRRTLKTRLFVTSSCRDAPNSAPRNHAAQLRVSRDSHPSTRPSHHHSLLLASTAFGRQTGFSTSSPPAGVICTPPIIELDRDAHGSPINRPRLTSADACLLSHREPPTGIACQLALGLIERNSALKDIRDTGYRWRPPLQRAAHLKHYPRARISIGSSSSSPLLGAI
jgi:hypothetical protein